MDQLGEKKKEGMIRKRNGEYNHSRIMFIAAVSLGAPGDPVGYS